MIFNKLLNNTVKLSDYEVFVLWVSTREDDDTGDFYVRYGISVDYKGRNYEFTLQEVYDSEYINHTVKPKVIVYLNEYEAHVVEDDDLELIILNACACYHKSLELFKPED